MIDIGSVLNEFDITTQGDQVRKFGIRYRKKGGLPGEMYNCRKGIKMPASQKRIEGESSNRSKGIYNLKFNGVILIHNTDTEETRSIKVAQITHFRQHNSKEWIKVIRKPY